MGNVIDYSVARPPIAALKAAEVTGVCRYQWIEAGLRPEFNRDKAITKSEYVALIAAGIEVLLICQVDKANYLGGYAEGLRHGRASLVHSRQMGHPDTRPVVLAIQDQGIPTANHALAVEYSRGFKDGRGQGPQLGYGGTDVLNKCVQAGHIWGIWKAAATSWSTQASNHIVLVQLPNIQLPNFPYNHDVNSVPKLDWGQYHPDTICMFGYRCPLVPALT